MHFILSRFKVRHIQRPGFEPMPWVLLWESKTPVSQRLFQKVLLFLDLRSLLPTSFLLSGLHFFENLPNDIGIRCRRWKRRKKGKAFVCIRMSFATEELKSDRKAEKGLHASELMASILPCVKDYGYTSSLPQMVPDITTAQLRLVLFLPQCTGSHQF